VQPRGEGRPQEPPDLSPPTRGSGFGGGVRSAKETTMATMHLDLPDTLLLATRQSPDEFENGDARSRNTIKEAR